MAKLFYLIGASGSGKDSLIAYARQHMDRDIDLLFAHRYITRPADAGGENHIALTEQEFHNRRTNGCFAMHWYSHDTWYGLGIEINQWLAKGLDVVVNGSREYLDQAAEKYRELCPVLITVSLETLRRRLESRGRESMEQINRRIEQAIRLDKLIFHPNLIRVENNSDLAEAGQTLLNIICDVRQDKCA